MDTPNPRRFRDNAPLFGVVAILVLTFVALAAFARPDAARIARTDTGRVPAAPVEALPGSAEEDGTIVSSLDPDDARVRNAAVPIADGLLVSAPPFIFRGSTADRSRARDCLALAAIAEAGSGDRDQRSVMQVVLNRVRHPAFANTVCGVVYEGSQRPTGCQFTFTCDGSLSRTYGDSLWRAARERAQEALGGYVHAPVGTATHYHADYVYPYWSSSLDKVAAVGPHLFFRWRGSWGGTRALSARYVGGEPDPMILRAKAQEVDRPEDIVPTLAEDGTPVRSITAPGDGAADPANAGQAGSPGPGVHFVLVSTTDDPRKLVERARALCPGDKFCQVYGWSEAAAIPAALPVEGEARAQLRFSFLPARSGNAEAIYYDCRLYKWPGYGSCLPRARP
ncbi:cell wall hydrolase [Qipengyuania zhejiangensis]|uniref:cell wall hydrolase n=1 Tax=Qipengyuania zhejiangensis TaxID=3077782 RepID=UPI002D779EA8|nr:cell wall hydrolase [Qipengyuania sp. Z2]